MIRSIPATAAVPLMLLLASLAPAAAAGQSSDQSSERPASYRTVGLFFQEVRFGHFNTFERWTREESDARDRLMAARQAVRMDRPIDPLLQLVKDHGANWRVTGQIVEPNVHYIEAGFLVTNRHTIGGNTSYTMHVLGFLIVANEGTDRWELMQYNRIGQQTLSEESARELGLL